MKTRPQTPESQSTKEIGASDLTTVELLWLEKRIENRIRFGRPVSEKVRGPQSTCPIVHSRQHPRLRALDVQRLRDRPVPHRYSARGRYPGQRHSTVPWITPGGESLLRLSGWPEGRTCPATDRWSSRRFASIRPTLAPEYWHHVHNRLSVNETPRPYTSSRHQAWLHRRRVTS